MNSKKIRLEECFESGDGTHSVIKQALDADGVKHLFLYKHSDAECNNTILIEKIRVNTCISLGESTSMNYRPVSTAEESITPTSTPEVVVESSERLNVETCYYENNECSGTSSLCPSYPLASCLWEREDENVFYYEWRRQQGNDEYVIRKSYFLDNNCSVIDEQTESYGVAVDGCNKIGRSNSIKISLVG
eukprot:CFRG4948T1